MNRINSLGSSVTGSVRVSCHCTCRCIRAIRKVVWSRPIDGRHYRSPTLSQRANLSIARHRYLDKFVADVVQVASRLRPLPDRPAEEARTVFAKKLELSMKLAISKYKPIQVGLRATHKVCEPPTLEEYLFIFPQGVGRYMSFVRSCKKHRVRWVSLTRACMPRARSFARISHRKWCDARIIKCSRCDIFV